jgi:hypothetical protein
MRTRTLKLLGLYLLLGILIGLSMAKVIPSALAAPLFLAVLLIMMIFIFAPYIPPSWAKRVGRDGKQEQATVLANDFFKAGGADLWVAVWVEVKPVDAPAFKSQMRCKTSQASKLVVGDSVSIRYDDKKKLVLMTG